MADKSPHDDHAAKKSGKAVKVKRSERKEKQRAATEMERLMHPPKSTNRTRRTVCRRPASRTTVASATLAASSTG